MAQAADTAEAARVLIVDDSDFARRYLRSILGGLEGIGEILEASSGQEGVEIALRERPQLVLMDIRMPGMDGITATEAIKKERGDIPVIAFSESHEPTDVRRVLEAGAAGYTVKSAEENELRLLISAMLQGHGVLSSAVVQPVITHYLGLLEASRERHRAVIESLAAAVEAKDVVTSSHLRRVCHLSVELAKQIDVKLALSEEFVFGCLLHDVGKIGIPEMILNKEGPLNDSEWEVMKGHPAIGMRVVEPLELDGVTLGIIGHHHERWDGRGYPDGLRGAAIPLAARIFTVCDAIDAMTSSRPYREGMTLDQAVERVRQGAGTQFDPQVVEALVKLNESDDLRLEDVESRGLVPGG
jgi:putative two-component system response regulator